MNKLMTKIVGATLGLAMAIGVGAGIANNKNAKEVNAVGKNDWLSNEVTSGLNADDYYVFATNNTTDSGGKYFDGTVDANPHWHVSSFGDNAPSSNSADGVIRLESISTNIWKIKLVSTGKYVTATKAGTKGSSVSASSDSDGWYFYYTNNSGWNAVYQHAYSSKYACFRDYNNGDFRSYQAQNATTAATNGYAFKIYKYQSPKTLSSISVSTAPVKTTYYAGEFFDPTGLVIQRAYTSGDPDTFTYAGHESDFSFSPSTTTALTQENTSVSITYGGKTTTQTITVNQARTISSIELRGTISKDEYYVGDQWDLTGLDLQVNWSEGEPTFVDLDDASVVYELTPATATNTSVTSFDIEIIYDNFDEVFTVSGLSVIEHPLVDVLDSSSIPAAAIGSASSSWGAWTEVTDYTYSQSTTDGAKYQVKLMGPGSSDYVGRMNNSSNGGFYTSKAPIGVRIKTISFSSIAASKNVSVYLSNVKYDSLPATADYVTTLTSTSLSYTVEGNFTCFAIRGRDSSLDVGALTIEYEELLPSLSASPSSVTLQSGGTENVEITVANFASTPTLECSVQSGGLSISSATVGAVNGSNKATATITASNSSGNAVVRVRDTAHPDSYYVDISVSVESVANIIENIDTTSSLAYHYSRSGAVVDRLDKEFTENSESGYADWSGKVGSSGAVYSGNTYGGATNIQLKSNDSISGIVTTTSGGYAKKITVVWAGGTSNGRTLDIYGKNTAYSTAADLYNNSTKGTKIGSIVCGTSTTLTINENYEFIGLRSNNGGMNLNSIDIQWGNYTYSYPTIAVRFGASLNEDLWDSLDTNSHLISGFGVMIKATNSSFSIKDNCTNAVAATATPDYVNTLVNYYSEIGSQLPPKDGNNCIWNLLLSVDYSDRNVNFEAAAYIKVGDEYVFFKQVGFSVVSLANDYLENRGCDDETAGGSLKYLSSQTQA